MAKGHRLMLSHSRDPANLAVAACSLGADVLTGTARDAAEFGEVVVLSVPVHLAYSQKIGEAGLRLLRRRSP